ncbi:MAG: TPM domain-containing protein, partial [Chitinophagaceae bacterium]|nr:TPM domain-containing protein [Chitinophagaceae bacterium]
MKYLLNTISKKIFFITILLLHFQITTAQKFPEPISPPRIVNDYVQLLSSEEFLYLENKLRKFNDTTSNEISIAIISTTNGDDTQLYATEMAHAWGIGKKGKDNGVLFLIAVEDKKMAIAVGYGLEGFLTDALAKRIVSEYAKPYFREKRYFEGIDISTDAIIQATSGTFKGEAKKISKKNIVPYIFPILIVLVLLIKLFGNRSSHVSSHGMGTLATLMMMNQLGRRGTGFGDFSKGSGLFGGSDFGGFGGGGFGGGG